MVKKGPGLAAAAVLFTALSGTPNVADAQQFNTEVVEVREYTKGELQSLLNDTRAQSKDVNDNKSYYRDMLTAVTSIYGPQKLVLDLNDPNLKPARIRARITQMTADLEAEVIGMGTEERRANREVRKKERMARVHAGEERFIQAVSANFDENGNPINRKPN